MPDYPHMQKSLDTITHISADLLGSGRSGDAAIYVPFGAFAGSIVGEAIAAVQLFLVGAGIMRGSEGAA